MTMMHCLKASLFRARQIVSEKLVTLGESLPDNVTPVLAPQSSVMGEIMFIGLQSDSTSMMDLRDIADWVIKPAILATGGVSQVTVLGGDEKQYQIIADPLRMEAYGVTMSDLEAVGKSLSTNSEGGIIRDRGNEYALRGISRTTDLDELGASIVKLGPDAPICLRDVADLRIGAAVRLGTASQNGKPAVIISVSKQHEHQDGSDGKLQDEFPTPREAAAPLFFNLEVVVDKADATKESRNRQKYPDIVIRKIGP